MSFSSWGKPNNINGLGQLPIDPDEKLNV